jgi:HK97 family phage prohead protease
MNATQTPEAGRSTDVLVRTYSFEAQMADDRTIDVRVVPFGEVADVADPPDFRPYREEFLPGVFAQQENAANRIYLRAGSGHDAVGPNGERIPGLRGVIGHGQTLVGREDGYHARFKMHNTPEADTARELVADGVYTGVSAEFYPRKNTRTQDGVIQRAKAILDSVLLTPAPAYSNAQVLAMREAEVTIDAVLLPPPIDNGLLARVADLGVELPDSMFQLLARAYTETPWDGSAARWASAEAYCSASAIDLNPAGAPKVKDRCHLPYKEPGSGEINLNGVRAALSRIGEGDPAEATQEQRDAARSMLEEILAKASAAQA